MLSIITSNEVIAFPDCACYALAAAGLLTTCAGIALMVDASKEPYDPRLFYVGTTTTVLGSLTTLSSCVTICHSYFSRGQANFESSTRHHGNDIEMGNQGCHNVSSMKRNQYYPPPKAKSLEISSSKKE